MSTLGTDLVTRVRALESEADRFWSNTHSRGEYSDVTTTEKLVFVFDQLRLNAIGGGYTDKKYTRSCGMIREYFSTTKRGAIDYDSAARIVVNNQIHFEDLGRWCRDQESIFEGVVVRDRSESKCFPVILEKSEPFSLSIQTQPYCAGTLVFQTRSDMYLRALPKYDMSVRDLVSIPTSDDLCASVLDTILLGAARPIILITYRGATLYAPNEYLVSYILDNIRDRKNNMKSVEEIREFARMITEKIQNDHGDLLGHLVKCGGDYFPDFKLNVSKLLDIPTDGRRVPNNARGFTCDYFPFRVQQGNIFVEDMFVRAKLVRSD